MTCPSPLSKHEATLRAEATGRCPRHNATWAQKVEGAGGFLNYIGFVGEATSATISVNAQLLCPSGLAPLFFGPGTSGSTVTGLPNCNIYASPTRHASKHVPNLNITVSKGNRLPVSKASILWFGLLCQQRCGFQVSFTATMYSLLGWHCRPAVCHHRTSAAPWRLPGSVEQFYSH